MYAVYRTNGVLVLPQVPSKKLNLIIIGIKQL